MTSLGVTSRRPPLLEGVLCFRMSVPAAPQGSRVRPHVAQSRMEYTFTINLPLRVETSWWDFLFSRPVINVVVPVLGPRTKK